MSGDNIPQALHDHLHEKGINTHAGIQGAEIAFEWIVTELCKLPYDDAYDQVCFWYDALHHEMK